MFTKVGNTYVITFDAGSGTTDTSNKEVTYGEIYGELPTPTYSGHGFLGWFTESEEGVQVTNETTVELESDITLYAHWESACVAEGTLVTMRDGSLKAVEMIEAGASRLGTSSGVAIIKGE